ncbi:conserved exported hypothetical protein [Verrucomicrobia bacterium]|nr:conserved exported hypothetical protein [Verrucomicrobiota bacterium]
MKKATIIKTSVVTLALGAGLAVATFSFAANEKNEAATETIQGEVVDLMCYLDHGAMGPKHRGCATICIRSGGPVGLLSGDKLYLVVGDHKPINEELVSKAAETIRIKGKVVERNGMRMIENAEIVK